MMINLYKILCITLFYSFLFGTDQFPPINKLPTRSNAQEYGFINQSTLNNQIEIIPIESEFKTLNSSRDNFNFDDASHLLMRTTIGPTLEEINESVDLGLDATLDMLFEKLEAPEPPGDWVFHSLPPNFSDLNSTQKDSIRDEWENRILLMGIWWLDLMKYSEMNIRETMVLFWHDHFATSAQTVQFAPSMYLQNKLFRKYASGNFKDLVNSINYDPAMLYWLDNDKNYYINESNNTINENYSRELLELFTMGEGNYSQEDIVEAARALTGIDSDGMYSFYSPIRHDHGIKNILGYEGNHNPEDVIDIIFEQPSTAEFICTKLYQWFVYEYPDEDIINQMMDILLEHNFEIEPVLKALLSSDHFFDENFRGAKYKNPIWYSVGTFRQLYLDYPLEHEFMLWYSYPLGEQLFYPPDVSGWDGYRSWINTYTLPYRKLFANQIIDGYSGILPEWDNVIEFSEKFDNNNPEVLIHEIMNYLFSVQPSEQTQALLLEELLDGTNMDEWSLYSEGAEERFKDVMKHMMRLEEFQLR